MKKFAIVTCGILVLAGGLFYGYLQEDQRPSQESRSSEPLSAKPAPIPRRSTTRTEVNQNQAASPSISEGKPSAPKTAAGAIPSQAPIGLRLAPDVRLPVAAMPLDFKVSPVAQKALEQIVEDYYRELALPPTRQGNADSADSTTHEIEESETGELTRVITNGPVVDQARKRADYRFKALFGNKAYNRMTMNTLLEARSPASPEK